MTHKETAVDYYRRGFLCSQSVLAAFAPECGLTEEQALKIGACFGGGMRKGEVCGACTGALMVLGALYGRHDIAGAEGRVVSGAVADRMMDRFAQVSGSYICNDLLGCDIRTPEGAAYARSTGLFTELCPKMVANAVDVLEEIIAQQEADARPRRSIKVLGSGCKSCRALFDNTQEAVRNAEDVQVEYVTDLQTIMEYGVMSMPALVIDGQVVSSGRVLKASEIKKLLGE